MRGYGSSRPRWRAKWVAAALVSAAAAAAPATAGADERAFFYTGGSQTFQVPPGVTSIQVDAYGGVGGGSYTSPTLFPAGGVGAEVITKLAVSSGELFGVWVGGAGQTAYLSSGSAGGAGGDASGAPAAGGAGGSGIGAAGGGGGGGASELTDGAGNVIVAAGGGGGAGGGGVNSVGFNGGAGGNPPQGGGGGVLGGNGGASYLPNGTAGGSAGDSGSGGGGGGGGGFPSGGTGGAGGTGSGPGGGGGAGSSYVESGALSSYFGSGQATSDGNGRVVITWTVATPVTVALKASKAQLPLGSTETYTATVKPPAGDPLPTGTVAFINQGTGQTLGTAPLSSTSPATAKFRTSALPHGTDSVYAVYSGDLNYQQGYSGVVNVTVYNRTISVSPSSLAFGTRTVGSTTAEATMVKNTGLDPLTIYSVATGSGPFAVKASYTNCVSPALLPGQTCEVVVAFSPTAAGSFTGALTIKDNATPSTKTVKLSGTAQ